MTKPALEPYIDLAETTRSGFVESVHRGMRSRMVDRGRLLLPSEGLIHEFQRYVLERLA